jgi:hypothetical protein
VTEHCKGVGSSEMKEETFKAQPSEKNKDDVGTLRPSCKLSENRTGRAALRREQRE